MTKDRGSAPDTSHQEGETPRSAGTGSPKGAPAATRAGGEPDKIAPLVLAIMPAFDEGPRIADVVRAAARHLPVVVVDDGSRDDTAAQAEAAGATVVRQIPNRGKGAALRTGFRHALEAGADAVVTLDADGQHDPAEIPLFVEAWLGGPKASAPPEPDAGRPELIAGRPELIACRPELIVGRRDFRRMPPIRRLANELGGRAVSWAIGRPIPDNQSGYRLIGRRLMADLLDSREAGFEFEVEMIARCIRAGHGLAWVPIRPIYAGAPSHVRPVAHLRHFARIVLAARRTMRG